MRALLVAAAALLAACPAPELGVEYRGETLDVVDAHLHSGEWEGVPPSTQRFLAERFPFPIGLSAERFADQQLSAEGILEQLDDGGVRRAVLFAVYAPYSVGIASNEVVAEHVSADPERLMGFASLRVDDWNETKDAELARLDAALDLPGMVGVKLAHTHMHFRMDDPAYYAIYDVAAAHGAPVYLHTGPSPFPGTHTDAPYTDPAFLEDAIATHPDTEFILGHLGYDFINDEPGDLEECLRLAGAYPNVWLEPSAMGSKGSDPDGVNLPLAMTRIREDGLTDRLIYGSDGPQSPGFVDDYLQRTLVAMEAGGWTAEEAQAGLAGNLDRLLAGETGR